MEVSEVMGVPLNHPYFRLGFFIKSHPFWRIFIGFSIKSHPFWRIFIGFSIKSHPFLGSPISGPPHICSLKGSLQGTSVGALAVSCSYSMCRLLGEK